MYEPEKRYGRVQVAIYLASLARECGGGGGGNSSGGGIKPFSNRAENTITIDCTRETLSLWYELRKRKKETKSLCCLRVHHRRIYCRAMNAKAHICACTESHLQF